MADDQGPKFTTIGTTGGANVVNVGRDYITINNAVLESIEERLKVVQDEKLDNGVQGWLSAPDVSQNLNAALRRRQAGTGTWFLDGAQFAEWKENPNIVLCMYGAPGCGKTVLCSSIIEAVKRLCATLPLAGWAYFFFDGRNANKGLRLYENFLRSVLSQLCSRCDGVPGAVAAMYRSHGKGRETPSVQDLEETLQQVMEAFDDVYIVVDSLDECEDKPELLQWIRTVASWNSANCHLLATTRPEPDITSRLKLVRNIYTIIVRGPALDGDIRNYLDGRLSLNSRWTEPIRALISTILLGGADGMFRWVAMQMDSLQSCMNTREVKEKLKILPKDLEETYEQILTRSSRPKELLHMLHWLAFSARELRLEEIAEVPSVDFEAADGPCYDPDLKYPNSSIALTICSGLVTEMDGTVKLAHFSVKEYLISDRIKTGMAAQFSMSARLSHSVIAQTCVAYLLIFNKPDSIQTPVTRTGPFPLHLYAAGYTSSHLCWTRTTTSPALQSLLLKLFIPAQHSDSALVNWVRMHDIDNLDPWLGVDVGLAKPAKEVTSPLYYASWLGLEHVVRRLLECGVNANLMGGSYGTALHAAASRSHLEILLILLESGADINIQGGRFATALQAAASEGSIEMTKLLLKHGADVNIQGGTYGAALHAAASPGSTEMTKLLLEHGADVNIQGGRFGTALQAAAWQGSIEMTKLLLGHGADINIQGGRFGTALQAAAWQGSIEMTKLLLKRGADVNIQGGYFGTALHAATSEGYIQITKLLLEHSADVNLQGGESGTALQAAASQGSIEMAKLLLERGADINLLGWVFGTALQSAAQQGSIQMVELLLDQGADINIQGGQFGTALTAAASQGFIEMTKLLLERGAHVNIQGGGFGTALLAAVERGSVKTVKLLFEHGADVNLQAGEFGTALLEAACGGSVEMIELLFENGADVNLQEGKFMFTHIIY